MLQYTITIEALQFVKGTIFSFGVTLSIPIMKVLLESSKLAYSYYNADTEVKLHLQKKGEETKKMREAEPQKKKDYKDDRNSLISSIQQVSPIWAKDILVTVLLVQVIGDGKFGGVVHSC